MWKFQRFLYKSYVAAYPVALRRKRRITTAGTLVFIATLMAAVFGIDTTKTTAYQLFTLLCCLFTIGFVASCFFRIRVSITRRLPPFATAGETLRYSITLRNHSKKRMDGLLLQEVPVIKYPTFEEFVDAREPGESTRNGWDRMVKYHRFQWLTDRQNAAFPREHRLPAVGANSYLKTYVELLPRHRGYLELSGIDIKRMEPFGLFKSSVKIATANRLLVLPKRYDVPDVRLPGKRKFHAGGIALASSVGNAEEFRSLREYRPGDPMRLLHWKSVAKTSELIIRENEDEFFVRHALVLDTFSLHPYSERFETAVSIAASLACTVRSQESMLDLMFVGDKAHCFSAGRGVDHTGRMLETLACITPCRDKPFSELYPLVRSHVSMLSGCICILQQWDEERAELIRILMQYNVPVKVLVTIEGDESLPKTFIPLHPVHTERPEEGLSRL